MEILIILAICAVIGIPFWNNLKYDWISFLLTVVCGGMFIVGIIMLPINRLNVNSEIIKFQTTENTIKLARENNNELEKAAIQSNIIEKNNWLASIQYYNQSIFDIWIPDEVMNLKPLK